MKETERYKSMVSNTCEVFADFGFKKLGLIKFKKINYVTLGRQNQCS